MKDMFKDSSDRTDKKFDTFGDSIKMNLEDHTNKIQQMVYYRMKLLNWNWHHQLKIKLGEEMNESLHALSY